jgi:hypothetical protein
VRWRSLLDPLAQKRSAVPSPKVKGAVWVRPELRAEVAYRGFTRPLASCARRQGLARLVAASAAGDAVEKLPCR